ncbi:MAG: DUF6798 domain-containing protein [Thermoguttaceae bacterium]|jgi:hypothetical protein
MGNTYVRTAAVEVAVIFLLCLLYGFWPVPDVNEPYYVGKAIHFWNRGVFASDPFLNSSDSHYLFYSLFGFFSLFLKPTALVWFGRITIWLFTSFGWQRLSSTLIPKRGWSILTAAAFFFYLEHFHLAGEWVIGGVEGKGLAFPFLFWGLALFLRRRYTEGFILMGLASAFHVLVGGWGVLAALGALMVSGLEKLLWKETSEEPVALSAKRLFFGLTVGGLIALAGIIPALMLDQGVPVEVQRQAHRIYVYERISHHLVPSTLPWIFRVRFLLLALVWFFFCRFQPNETGSARAIWRLWNRFVGISLLIAGIGLFWDYGIPLLVRVGWLRDGGIAADMLRFYWFRLSDWTVPAGVAFGSCVLLAALFEKDDFAIRNPLLEMWAPILILAGVFFVAAKKIFLAYAASLTKAAPVSPPFPVSPEPVDAIAFLAMILAFGIFAWLPKTVCRTRTGRPNAFVAAVFFAVPFTLAVLAPAWGVVEMTTMKTGVLVPRSNPPKESISNGWLNVCRWARENTPDDAVFLVPRGYGSWKWNSHRAEVGNWKEIPQDAASMVKWFALMEDLYTTGTKKGKDRWNNPLIAVILAKGEKRILRQAEKYHINYIVVEQPPYHLASQPKAKERFDEMMKKYKVYQNSHFIVFKVD